jgi:hypothetical protein
MSKRKQPVPAWREVYRVHPAADVFPMLSEPELRELGEDIKANGLVTPIVFWRPGETDGEEPVLLDGRNRLDAMELVGLPTIARNEYLSGGAWAFDEGTWKSKGAKKGQMPGWRPVQYLSGKRRSITGLFDGGAMVDRVTAATDPVAYVIAANIRRRHLTKAQQAEMIAMAVTAGNDSANMARSFSPKSGKRGGSTKDPIKATVVEEAKKLDISPRTAERALQVVRDKESAKEAATGSRVSPDPDPGKGRGRARKPDLGPRARAHDAARDMRRAAEGFATTVELLMPHVDNLSEDEAQGCAYKIVETIHAVRAILQEHGQLPDSTMQLTGTEV